MSTRYFTSALGRCSLLVLLVTLFSGSAFAGRDFYEVYLNNKLIKRQYMGEATTGLMDLKLDKSNLNDKLVIYYTHCNTKGAGKGRNIVVKNDRNQVLKEWKFADATGQDLSMSIPVKDVLELQKNNPASTLNIYYYSTADLPDGLKLAAVAPVGKPVTYIPEIRKKLPGNINLAPEQITGDVFSASPGGKIWFLIAGKA